MTGTDAPKPESDGADDRPVDPQSEPDDRPGPNLFVDNSRRRIPGVVYCVVGAAAGVAWLVRAGDDPILVNAGLGVVGVLLIAFGVYSIVTGRRLVVDEEAALLAAAVAVQRPMGHASAQMAWRGWTSRPTWRILWYSAEDPPRHRGLVFVDGLDGTVLDAVTEPNPETGSAIDWSLEDDRD